MNEKSMDAGVLPMVEYFNSRGLTTVVSCEGHNKTNMSMFWIQFDKSTTKQEIVDFMKNHSVLQGPLKNGEYVESFGSCGRFAERVFWSNGQVFYSWCYFAATKESADQDLSDWIERYKGDEYK